jgi:hypothetical protein
MISIENLKDDLDTQLFEVIRQKAEIVSTSQYRGPITDARLLQDDMGLMTNDEKAKYIKLEGMRMALTYTLQLIQYGDRK